MIIKIDPASLEIDKKFQGLCRKPYHGHPKGCPNYGKKEACPPGQPLIGEILDLNENVFLIYTLHNIGYFAEKMMERHPEWNSRQCYNPRYWQGTARKFHKAEREKALQVEGIERIIWPENHGVNVSKLMEDIGIDLNWEWPPEHNLENSSYIVSLGGRIAS